MSILNIVSTARVDEISHKVIQYLADAGHQVYLVADSHNEQHFWLANDHHNLLLLKAGQLSHYHFDCEFCYGSPPITTDVCIVKLVLVSERGTGNRFSVVLEQRNVLRILTELCLLQSESDFIAIRQQLVDILIDGFIALSREEQWTRFMPYTKSNEIDSWYLAEQQNVNLRADYSNLLNRYEVFSIKSTEAESESARQSVSLFAPLSRQDAALLVLFLQYIFNAEKEALYGFFEHLQEGQLTRYGVLAGGEYYSDISDVFLSSVSEEPFVDDSYIKSVMPFPDMGITSSGAVGLYDNCFVAYWSNADSAGLVYNKRFSVFCSLDSYVTTFQARVGQFKSGAINWQQFCQLPKDFVQKYYQAMQPAHTDYPQKTIVEMFEEQVPGNPDGVALIYGGHSMSYSALNAKANELAHYLLMHYPLCVGDRVAIQLPRDFSLMVSLLAIEKLGCAYVPLDTSLPAMRIQAILRDAEPGLVLTHNSMPAGVLPDGMATALITGELLCGLSQHYRDDNLSVTQDPEALAYVIYTSGTTGVPKGVAVRQRNFINIAYDFGRRLNVSSNSRMLAVTTLAFDISTLELFMPLMFGGSVVLAEQNALLEANTLQHYLTHFGITHMQATPSFWRQVVAELGAEQFNITSLCGGEAVPLDVARGLAKMTLEAWNVYGPTETTVWSTAYRLRADIDKVLIGKPLANTNCYVLNDKQKPVAPGVTGELYIAGDGVAKGYFNDSALTSKSFVDNPFAQWGEGQSAVMYRTGDKVRYLPGGEIEYLSRVDHQVKLRGHRIELGDIEAAIKAYEGVIQAVVQLQKTQDKTSDAFLVGYYTALAPINTTSLQQWLAGRLPEYMIPVDFMYLASIPLNLNGKVDRKSLPVVNLENNHRHLAPENQTQQTLCDLFGATLGKSNGKVGIMDDFFALGGNSLSAIRLVNLINTEFHCDIKIRDVFELKNVSSLTPLVKDGKGEFLYRDFIIHESDEACLYHPFPLNNVQQTYYFGRFKNFELSDVSTHIYHEYVFGEIAHARLEQALNILIQRHPSLRTVFENGEQRYLNQVPYYRIDYQEFDIQGDDKSGACDQGGLGDIRRKFSHKVYSPDQYPLFDILLSKAGDKYILHVSFDAIIVDMKSFEILFSEWFTLYQDPQAHLPELAINYRDYHVHYERIRQSHLYTKAESYWREKAEQISLKMDLPLASSPAGVDKPFFKRVTRTIPQTTWQLLLDKCRINDISPTALIAELFSRTLCFWSGQDQLCLNLTLFNRLPLHSQVDDIIGDFTVLSLLDYRLRNDISARRQLEKVHLRLLEDVEHNLFDGVDVQRMLKQERGLPSHQVVAPVVLTSVIGMSGKASMFELPLNQSYQGMQYAISQTSQVWLDHKAYETGEGFVAEWDYVGQLFSEDTIRAMHESYCALIGQVAHRDWDLMALPMLTLPDSQRDKIIQWNETTSPYVPKPLFVLFEQSPGCVDNPHSVAVVDSQLGTELTYAELETTYRKLGAALMANGEKKGNLIAVLAEKGHWHVVATLGIMKIGAAYIPLHPDWPVKRLNDILEQSGCHTVLVSKSQQRRLDSGSESLKAFVLVLDSLLEEAEHLSPPEWPTVLAEDLAYVIFTSGSTGRPKGVAISHYGACNTIEAVNSQYHVTCDDTVLALSELSFDLSVYDIFGVLARGGKVVFPRQQDSKEPGCWLALIREHNVTLWNTVPQLAGLLMDEVESHTEPSTNIRLFLLSGDWIPTNLPARIQALTDTCQVISLGGATEGSIWSIWYEIDKVNPEWTSIPYGTAMPNQAMYVLDSRGQHCPFGVTGEIHIGGDGVALKYWNAEQLTQQRFIYHPELGRLYKTGDLGRWSANGYIEFLGRIDNQVKLNGYRVELEEIASHINKLQGVLQALVHLQQDNPPTLVAYVVADREQPIPIYREGKDAFILAQHGIEPVGKPAYSLSHSLPRDKYITRKSYRKFNNEAIDRSAIQASLERLTERAQLCLSSEGEPGKLVDLNAVLSVCAALEVPGRALPKYRYPSASGTYSVQVYAGLNNDATGNLNGYYYYHPVCHSLYKASDRACADPGVQGNYLDLVVKWEAICPVYHERSRILALLEAGHILAMLTQQCAQKGIGYQVELFEPDMSADRSLLCRLLLDPPRVNVACLPEVSLALYERCGSAFNNTQGEVVYDCDDQSVFVQSSNVHAIVSGAGCLISLGGSQSVQNFVYAGWSFQHLSDDLLMQGIGSCMLGLSLGEGNLYTMAVGGIREEDRESFDVLVGNQPLGTVIRQALSHTLPEYMLPQHCLLMPELPLSANGKIDLSRLPRVVQENTLKSPETELEQQICKIWAQLLNCKFTDIDCAGSFFNSGGNSLLAMRLSRKLSQSLGVNFKLENIYNNNTVIAMAEKAASQMESQEREIGVL